MVNFRDSYFSVKWDISRKHLSGTFWGKQYDTGRGFAVTVINGGQVVTPTTEVLRLKWEKPDNTAGYVNATVVNGKFIIENIDQMFTVAGSVRADFELSVAGEFVASITFYVNVEKAVAVGAIESSSEFTALQDAVGSVDSLQQTIRDNHDEVTAQLAENTKQLYRKGRAYANLSPSFVFLDDDTKSEVYTILKPMFDAKGIKGTLASITGRLDTAGYMTKAQLKEMYNDGWDVQSHTRNHTDIPTVADLEVLETEFKNSKLDLENLGFDSNIMVYPFGRYTDAAIKILRKYFDFGVTTHKADYNPRPLNSFSINRYGIGSYSTLPENEWVLATYIPYIQHAIDNNEMCIFMTHIGETNSQYYALIEQIIDYVHGLGYEWETMKEALAKHQNALEVGDYSLSYPAGYMVIGAGGEIENSFEPVIYAYPNEFNSQNVPTDFKERNITITTISGTNVAGFPDTSGTLLTYRLSGDDRFTYQVYKLYNQNKEYMRTWYGSDWSEWTLTPVSFKTGVLFTSVITDFPKNQISYAHITQANATGFPEVVGGELETHRLTNDDSGSYQLFKPYGNNNMYKRTWNTGTGSWNLFENMENIIKLQDTTIFAKAWSLFPLGMSYQKVFGADAGSFPVTSGGILITNKTINERSFVYQEYHPLQTAVIYKRYPLADNTWSAFAKVGI